MPMIQLEVPAVVVAALQREAESRNQTPREVVRELLFSMLRDLVERNRRPTDSDPLGDAEKAARQAYYDSLKPNVTVIP